TPILTEGSLVNSSAKPSFTLYENGESGKWNVGWNVNNPDTISGSLITLPSGSALLSRTEPYRLYRASISDFQGDNVTKLALNKIDSPSYSSYQTWKSN